MEPTPTVETSPEPRTTSHGVVRNTLYLTLSQAITMPLAVLVNAVTARYLGAEIFGYLYLAATFTGFGSLAVTWGHDGVLPAMVARDHSVAGELLGSSLAWHLGSSLFVYAVLALICQLFGYEGEMQWALGLAFIGTVLTSLIAACKDTIRGFERADIPAYAHIGQQFLGAAFMIAALLLGGRMRAVLIVANVSLLIVLLFVLRTLRPVGVGRLSVTASASKALLVGGTPFVIFGLAMALQPSIDALYLSKLGSVEAVGWYAVARRLVGLLLFPAAALIGALYPTLSRLWVEDRAEYLRVSRGSLQSVGLLVMPVALGCALYPELGVTIFSKKSFLPAADDLRILSVFVFLVYFTMPLGTAILAAGKQRIWSFVQSLCVLVSLVLDPLLTPWFERRYGNGGLGPCVASVVSEVVVTVCGLALLPRGVFDARLGRSLGFALISGLAMAIVARALHSITPFVAAPLAVLAYGAALWFTGEINGAHVERVRGMVLRKLNRA